jgi:hypothetical protein
MGRREVARCRAAASDCLLGVSPTSHMLLLLLTNRRLMARCGGWEWATASNWRSGHSPGWPHAHTTTPGCTWRLTHPHLPAPHALTPTTPQISGGQWNKDLLFTVPREHPEVERLEGRYKK